MLICTLKHLFALRPFEPGLNRGQLPERWKALGYTRGAEIGVECGYNAKTILERWPGFLYLIDIWIDSGQPDTPEKVCVKELAPFAGRFEMMKMPSVEAAKRFDPNFLDCIYIDAEHTYEAVKADLEAWYPIVRSGGMVSGHDFGVREPNERRGVAEAVMEFADTLGVTLYVVQNEGEACNWHFMK